MFSFLTKPRDQDAAVGVVREQLASLRSFALSDRLAVAKTIQKGLSVRLTSGQSNVENVDLSPLFESQLLSAEQWAEVAKRGNVDRQTAELLLRYIRVYESALETFGVVNGMNWLRQPNSALGKVVPTSLLYSEDGGRAVETLLERIAYGIAS